MQIVFDTGFFSSIFKIGGLDLVKSCFGAEEALMPKAVYTELLKFNFHKKLPISFDKPGHSNWIGVVEAKPFANERFGLGEREAIAMAKEKKALLLIDDFAASRFAQQNSVLTLSLASFLMLCKEKKLLSKAEMRKLISDLRQKDHYEFSAEVKKRLLM